MGLTAIESATTVAQPARWAHARVYALVVLALIALLNTMDQSILSVSASAIQAEFQLSDGQIGFLSSAFVVIYGIAALPVGYWVDRFSRRAIVGLGVALWNLCTLATGFTQSFPQIFAARAALGIGEATTVPASVSLLGDLFTKRNRGRAAGINLAASRRRVDVLLQTAEADIALLEVGDRVDQVAHRTAQSNGLAPATGTQPQVRQSCGRRV